MAEISTEASSLIKKLVEEFESRVSSEQDTSTILLKGHLLIEYYLDHLIILLFDKDANLYNLGFYQKIKKLQEKKMFSRGNI
jgi:hypothetical protein